MFGLRAEKKAASSKFTEFGISILSILIALLLGSVLLIALSYDPLNVYTIMLSGGFGSFAAIARTITQTIPLLLVGVGLALAFKTGVWNIGAPGQLIVGAIVATVAALYLPSSMPGPLHITIIFLLSFLAAAGFAAICAYLNLRIGLDMVLSTLMLNYIAYKLLQHLLYGPLGNPELGFPTSATVPDSVQLPTIAGTSIHYPTLILGLAAAILIYIIMRRTKLGYEIKVFGENPRAAEVSGMNRFKIIMFVTLVSGGLAGLAGAGEVIGSLYMLKLGIDGSGGVYATSYGYTAIIIAALGRNNALGAVIASFFIGGILVGGHTVQLMEKIPYSLVTVLLGLILLSLTAGLILTRYKIVRKREGARLG